MSERTEQQREAVAGRDRDVFLRAGAGTGKTTVLVDRFCSAALDPDAGVERILAFTFTERAADQLRRRVREELSERADAAEGEQREQLLEAVEATDRAWISTIHGFCRRLLASHPAAAGIDPRFRVVDEAEADRLAARAFDAALETMVESGGGEALELAAANRPRDAALDDARRVRRAAQPRRSRAEAARPAGRRLARGDRRADRGRARGAHRVRRGDRGEGRAEPGADRRGGRNSTLERSPARGCWRRSARCQSSPPASTSRVRPASAIPER